MLEETLELGGPVVVGDVVLRPIARRRVATLAGEDAEGLLARLIPVGLVVEERGTSRAVDLDGDELADDVLDQLAEPGEG